MRRHGPAGTLGNLKGGSDDIGPPWRRKGGEELTAELSELRAEAQSGDECGDWPIGRGASQMSRRSHNFA